MEGLVFILFILAGSLESAQGQSIITPPANATGILGGTAKFDCVVDLGTFQKMTWEFNDIIIFNYNREETHYPTEEAHRYSVDKNFTLTVKNLKFQDGGRYTCDVHKSRKTAALIVLDKPSLILPDSTPLENDTVVYNCEAWFGGPDKQYIASNHNPNLVVLLEHNDLKGMCQEIESRESEKHVLNKICSITVSAEMHNKELICEVSTSDPVMNLSASTSLTVLYPVRNTSYTPQHRTFEIGSSIFCTAIGNPTPTFRWDKEITQGAPIFCNQLIISKNDMGDNVWKCTAMNTINGITYTQNITVIFEAGKIPPIIIPTTAAIEIKGGTAKFKCKVEYGDYPQALTWKFNQKAVYTLIGDKDKHLNVNKYNVTRDGKKNIFTLEVKNLTIEDGGLYVCEVMNSKLVAVLIVLGHPLINSHSSNYIEGEMANYICNAQFGGPEARYILPGHYPQLRAFIDDLEIYANELNDSNDDFNLSKVYEITVDSTMHNKDLSCEISTTEPKKHQVSFSSMNILYSVRNITYSPNLTSYEFGSNITCAAEGNPSPSIEWKNRANQEIIIESDQLHITEDMKGDNKWVCIARNIIDEKHYNASITAEFEAVYSIEPASVQSKDVNYTWQFIAFTMWAVFSGIFTTVNIWRAFKISDQASGMHNVTPKYFLIVSIIVFGNSFPHGWNTGVLNIPQNLIKDFIKDSYNDRYEHDLTNTTLEWLWSVSVSIYLLGGFVGVVIAHQLADKYGRKKPLTLCLIPVILSAIIFCTCKTASSFEMLIIARLFVGLGCGASSLIAPMYLIEITPNDKYHLALGLHDIGFALGIVFSQISSVFGKSNWPYLLAIPAIPCVVSFFMLRSCPETPYHLFVNRNEEDKTREVLHTVYKGNADSIIEQLEERRSERDEMFIRMLLEQPKLRWPFILICSLATCQQICVISVIYYYSFSILTDSGLSANLAQYLVLFSGIVHVVIRGLMSNVGRRRFLLGGIMIMVISQILITVDLYIQTSYIAAFSIYTFVIGFALQLGSIQQAVKEMFEQGPRSPARTLMELFSWGFCFLVVLIFPHLKLLAGPGSLIISTVLLMGFGIFFFIKFPETKGKTTEEIYRELSGEEPPSQTQTIPGEGNSLL